LAYSTEATGQFALNSNVGVGQDVVATFKYNIVDTHATTAAARRALVTSDSDTTGEYVVISEVAAIGSSATSSNSVIFRGAVTLTEDPSKATNQDGEVWVRDADTLTVTFLDTDGTTSLDTDTVVVDTVAPVIGNIDPAFGLITSNTSPLLSFDVTDSVSQVQQVLLVITGTGASSTVAAFNTKSIENGATHTTAITTNWLTTFTGLANGVFFKLEIVAQDKAGNRASSSSANAMKIDTAGPTITGAVTGTANTAVTVTFNEDLDAASVNTSGSDFTVAGVTVTAAAVDSTNANEVDLTVSALTPDAKPKITVSNVKDKALNVITAASEYTATKDKIAPTLIAGSVSCSVGVDTKLAVAATVVKTCVNVDERLTPTNKGVVFTIAGPSGSNANKSSKLGTLSVVSTDQFNLDTTLTVPASPATGMYGVSIEITDASPDLNKTTNLTTVTNETPTLSTDRKTLTVAKGPIGDKDFSGAVGTSDVIVLVNSTTTNATTTAVDASARTITMESAISADATVVVTYGYVATDVFEIDVTAPTLVAQPKAALTSQRPLLRVEFSDDDGYPGDTHLTVTLTTLTLTDPSGNAVTTAFTTSDNKEWIWEPSADLALGAYALAYTITDDAANTKSDTLTFTIKKRTTDLTLKPGWNLVSLPDDPPAGKRGINDVFTTSTAVDSVVTYDRRVKNWFSASRQADGTLGRPGSDLELTTIDGSRAYWVHLDGVKNLTVTVEVPGVAPGDPVLPRSFGLAAGWNMVPFATSDLINTVFDADDYFTGLDWSRALRFDNDTGQYVGIPRDPVGSPVVGNDVTIGNGYWVFLKEAGELTPP